MQAKTKQEYLRLAEYFLITRLRDRPITPKTITDALIYAASEYRPAYWRRLRKALELHQLEKGFHKSAERIASTVNPVTKIDVSTGKRAYKSKTKQKRVKSVSEDEYQKLLTHLERCNDMASMAAIVIARYLGCRPAEMPRLEFLDNNVIYIPSVKQTKDRGLDRNLIVPDKIYKALKAAHSCLEHDELGKTSDMARIQRRLQRHLRNIWPQRKNHISLYSFRHQLGSDLKASGLPNNEIGAIMGHQSIKSVDVYGNKRKAYSHIEINPTIDTIAKVRQTVKKKRATSHIPNTQKSSPK